MESIEAGTGRQSEEVMMETKELERKRRKKVVPPESTESGIEESDLAMW